MALPVFRASSSVQNVAAGDTIVVTKPTGVVDGDALLVAVFASGITGTFTTVPTGWTELLGIAAASGFKMYVYWKVAASEGASWSWVASNAARKLSGACVAYSGAHATTPVHVSGSSGGGLATDVVAPTITTTVANCVLVFLSSLFDDDGITQSGTVPAGMTEREDNNPADTGDRTGAYAATENFATAGATGTRTMVQSSAESWAAALVALRPPASGFGQWRYGGFGYDSSKLLVG